MTNIKDRFEAMSGVDIFQRVDEIHPLDIYIGLDDHSQPTLFIASKAEPSDMASSKIISVEKGRRQDERWALSFSLLDMTYEDIFYHFCNDIVESSRGIQDSDKGMRFICGRYSKWQQMMAKSKADILPVQEIKGLIGEMMFLKLHMVPEYGQEKSLKSWIGPDYASQDFVCNDSWFEVKATTEGNDTITISSIEQLDSKDEGTLAVVYLEKTSMADCSGITLNSIFDEIIQSLPEINLQIYLSDMLLNRGYYKCDDYEKYCFKYIKLELYKVGDDFPCLRRENLPSAIVDAKYDLSLAAIAEYLRS